MTDTGNEAQRAELPNVHIFFDECEAYFERPVDGGLEDATEFLAGFETEVRLAAIAFAEKYGEAAYARGAADARAEDEANNTCPYCSDPKRARKEQGKEKP